MLINRTITASIDFLIDKYPIIALTGPRQSGKTTLLKSLFSKYAYVSLENPDNREFARTDPNGFLNLYAEYVIIDEAQRVPELFSYIQTKVDESGKMGQYILSGSQNFHLLQGITQSLAGRVAILKLFPFDFNELQSDKLLSDSFIESMLKGFYPAIFDRQIPSTIFFSNYIQTYLQRDVSELIAVKDIRLFQSFLGLCATRTGQLLNLNALANECGISQPTAKSWLSALENSYITFQLYPFFENYSKRIVKTPKLYFYDTGLACYLLKIRHPEQIHTHSLKGNLFENMMISEYVKRINHGNEVKDIWFWRDSSGHEIDLLMQDGIKLHLFEFKAGQTVMPEMFKELNYFEKLAGGENITKTLVFGGNSSHTRTDGKVVSWRDV